LLAERKEGIARPSAVSIAEPGRRHKKAGCIRDTRKKLRCSRAVFARKLRINERTLEKWEQGRAKPNPQAAALVLLVRKYPDTLERLDQAAVG
jgi:putative transcriptional regulator